MALFVTSTTAARGHGVFGLLRSPPAVIRATGSARTALVGQFAWGPHQTLTTMTDIPSFLNKVAPPGMSRTTTGYLAWMGKAWPDFKWVRVLGTAAAPAAYTATMAGPTNIATFTLKYAGTAGNSVTLTISNATDGDVNHFNAAISVTGATGTTTDLIENLNYSGTGPDSTPDLSDCILIGSIAKLASGRPTNGTFTFAGGADGTINSAAYVGTQGAGDVGFALLEGDEGIDGFLADDCGNSLRDAVNTGGVAHADYMADRVYYMNGDSGMTAASAITDVASFRSLRGCYVDNWTYVNDDVDGTERLIAPAAWAASVAANLPPSTSVAWKSSAVSALLRRIVRLEANRGQAKSNLEAAGINTIIQKRNGGFAFESAVVTNAPNDPSTELLTRTRMAHYIARSERDSLQEFVDAPNVALNQQDEVNAIQTFLSGLKRAASVDPNNLPHIVDFSIDDLKAFNPQASTDAGDFTIPQSIKTSSGQKRIFLSLNIGPSVSVNVQL